MENVFFFLFEVKNWDFGGLIKISYFMVEKVRRRGFRIYLFLNFIFKMDF